jgi:uncharacterized protein
VRFWDSSALIPLVVEQATSPEADRWLAQDDQMVLWTLTPVEITSAIRRLVREGAVPESVADDAEVRADDLWRTAHVVIDIEGVKREAQRLLRLHPLRAADSLQLAAGLEWARGRVPECTFHTLDARLGRSARREGFRVIPPPR